MRQFPSRYAFRALRNLPEKELRYLRTIIVIADIDEGFAQWALPYCYKSTPKFDLLASVRRHPLYIHLRVSRELCFW